MVFPDRHRHPERRGSAVDTKLTDNMQPLDQSRSRNELHTFRKGLYHGDMMKSTGKPDAGNLHVRFDEGEQRDGATRPLLSTLPFLDSEVIDRNDEFINGIFGNSVSLGCFDLAGCLDLGWAIESRSAPVWRKRDDVRPSSGWRSVHTFPAARYGCGILHARCGSAGGSLRGLTGWGSQVCDKDDSYGRVSLAGCSDGDCLAAERSHP